MSKRRKTLSRVSIGRIIAADKTPAVAADEIWAMVEAYIEETENRIIDAEFKAHDAARAEREACAKRVPTNWCDSLLTGPAATRVPLDCPGVEKLLLGVRDRILNAQ